MILKGEAKPLPPRYMEGFKYGWNLAMMGKSINDGCYGVNWGAVSDGFGNGAGEGNTSARMRIAFTYKMN